MKSSSGEPRRGRREEGARVVPKRRGSCIDGKEEQRKSKRKRNLWSCRWRGEKEGEGTATTALQELLVG
jgi:hypothetical protein